MDDAALLAHNPEQLVEALNASELARSRYWDRQLSLAKKGQPLDFESEARS